MEIKSPKLRETLCNVCMPFPWVSQQNSSTSDLAWMITVLWELSKDILKKDTILGMKHLVQLLLYHRKAYKEKILILKKDLA
jgi:hypothetical protein